MNILIVSQYFWPENFPINDFSLGLSERGHRVTVLTGIPNYPVGRFFDGYGFFRQARQNYHGIEVLRAPLLPRGRGRLRLSINYLSFAVLGSLTGPFLCREPYDLVLVYEPSPITVGLVAWVMKLAKNAPMMFWVQDLWPESLSATGMVRARWILNLIGELARFIYARSDLILVQSRAFFEPIEKFGVSRERIVYLPNSADSLYHPVDPDRDSPAAASLPDGFRVMFAGNIGAAQDFQTILAAAERLTPYPDIHWVILGDGRDKDWVEDQVRRRRLTRNVHLIGRHPVQAMPGYFALAQALLVTLRDDPIFSLTIPSKIQAYLACGRPIIAGLDGEGARVVREAGAGLAVPAGNPEALAGAVLELYNLSDKERRAMGLAGRRYFEAHFERNLLLDRLVDYMNRVSMEAGRCAS